MCVILCLFILFTTLSLDYTYLVRHPTFCKMVQKSSHILLNVNFVLVHPMHIFRGSSLYKFEKQTPIMLIC
jgi:hypothetical protein